MAKELKITIRLKGDLMDNYVKDVDALGVTKTGFAETIVSRYYENGKSFSCSEDLDKIKVLTAKLEARDNELAVTKKNLESHADRLDKQYKQIADLKGRIPEEQELTIEELALEEYYDDLPNKKIAHYRGSLSDAWTRIGAFCATLEQIVAESKEMEYDPKPILARLSDMCIDMKSEYDETHKNLNYDFEKDKPSIIEMEGSAIVV